MTHYTTTSANVNSAAHRLTHRPQTMTCEICREVPAVRRVWHTDARTGENWSANVCAYCAGKVGR